MKLARFSANDVITLGRVEGEKIINLAESLPIGVSSVETVLAQPNLLNELAQVKATAENTLALDQVHLLAPIVRPGKFMCMGMNYKDHEEEARRLGVPIPTSQIWFSKQISCINGPFDDVHFPKGVEKLDYEAELGVVISKGGRRISEEDALNHVAGYFVANDVSARDWQAKSPTWTLGKSFDTHGPIGPWIVTADEIANPQDLTVSLSVNGESRQKSSTSLMTYSVAKQIAYISQVMTLEPGDILITGTPAGVGIAMDPPTFLQVGDIVRVEISGIGHIENKIIAEPN